MTQDAIMMKRKKQFRTNNDKDILQTFEETWDIEGYQEKLIVRLDDVLNCEPPWYLTNWGFWLYSFFMMTIIPRIVLTMNTTRATYNIVKQIVTKKN